MITKIDIKIGDCLEKLKEIPDESIDCCVTSPPYWALRDYGTASWEGGDPNCDHKGKPFSTKASLDANFGNKQREKLDTEFFKEICGKCGAKRIDSQLGLENTPEEYVDDMVQVFREVRRVLKKEGTLWLNLGDSYNGSGGDHQPHHKNDASFQGEYSVECGGKPKKVSTLKPKDLIGIPWRVAFALQADGWYLRQDIIWAKPNPMPESVTDRCTKSHEYIFLLAKSQKYFYDHNAIKEKSVDPESFSGRRQRNESAINIMGGFPNGDRDHFHKLPNGKTFENRNKRDVWTVTTKPFKEAHFATFPEDLIAPCILAGCPRFVCKKCGKARERIVERGEFIQTGGSRTKQTPGLSDNQKEKTGYYTKVDAGLTDCGCNAGFEAGTVLDPFTGSGTTGVVAKQNNRNFVGTELNPAYVEMAMNRIGKTLNNPVADDIKRREEDLEFDFAKHGVLPPTTGKNSILRILNGK